MGIGASLDSTNERLSLLLYGGYGSGKSTSALGLAHQGRIVAIDAEGGMKPSALKARGVPIENIDVWPPDGDVSRISFDSIEQEVYIPLRKALEEEPGSYVGVVIDSFSELNQRLIKQAVDESTIRDRAKGKDRARFQTNLEDYGTSNAMIRQLLRMFRDLNLHLVITALERRDEDDDGFVSYGPALGPSAANDTAGLVDCVIWTQVEQIGPNAAEFYTGTTRSREKHRAKDRFGVLPVRMIEPSADRVLAYMRGELSKSTDERHKAAVAAARPVE